MEQTSKLSIVVDTTNAKKQINDFRTVLKKGDTDAKAFATSLDSMFSTKSTKKITAAVGTIGSTARGLQTDLSNTVKYMDNFSTHAVKFGEALTKISASASGTKTSASAIGSLNTQVAKIVAQAAGIVTAANSIDKFSRSLTRLTTATAGTSGASTSIGALNPKLRSLTSATQAAAARNSSLASSYTLVNTGLQSNTQYLARANQSLNANSSVSVKAQLAQDKLAASAAKVAAAQSRAAAAATRAEIAVKQLAIAEQRLQTAVTNRNNASVRAVSTQLAQNAATSRAAGAAANASNAIDRAASASLRLGQAQARASGDADRHARGLDRTNRSAMGLHGALTRLKTLLLTGAGAVGVLGFLKIADAMQSLDSQVKLVTKSHLEYETVREQIRLVADKNYSDIEATTNLYQKSARALANLGKTQKEAIVFTDAVSLAMRTGGRSAGEQSAAILQLGQAMGAGVVMGDEFRSISENAPILLDLVAKKMGVLPGQLKEMSREGKITAEVMFDALSENIDLLEDMAKQMPITMSQGFNVARNKFKEAVGDMMNQTGGLSSKIASAMVSIAYNFETIAKSAIIVGTLALAGFVFSANAATAAMVALNAVMYANPFTLVLLGLTAVSIALYGVNDVFDTSKIVVGDFFDLVSSSASETAELMKTLTQDVTKEVSTWWDWLVEQLRDGQSEASRIAKEGTEKDLQTYWGYYKQREVGFAGFLQKVTGNLSSVGALFATFFEYNKRLSDELFNSIENVGKAFINMYRRMKGANGGKPLEYYGNGAPDIIQIYREINSENQTAVADYYRGVVKGRDSAGQPIGKDNYIPKNLRGTNNFNSLLNKNSGGLVRLPAAAQLPEWLMPNTANLNDVIDPQKAIQAEQLKIETAIKKQREEDLKAAKEAAKAQAKIDKEIRAANSLAKKTMSAGRLVGVSGDTGVGTAHLHIQRRDKREPTKAEVNRFSVNGKSPYAYGVTSEYGYRGDIGVKGASKNHKGLDFGVGMGGKVTTTVPTKDVKLWYDPKGGGWVSTVTFADGLQMDLLHLDANSKKYVKSGSSTGDKQLDALAEKYDNAEMKALQDRQKELEAAAQEAQRAAEELQKKRESLAKEYAPADVRLGIDNNARLEAIQEGQLPDSVAKEYAEASLARYDRELAAYNKQLDDKVSSFKEYLLTESDMLKKQRDESALEVLSDPEFLRAGNADRLKQALENIDAQYDHRLERHNFTLDKEESSLYDFAKTEREIMVKNHFFAVKEAQLATDEIAKIRAEARVAQNALELSTLDANEALKLHGLKENHMSKMDFIREQARLEIELINLGTETTAVKIAQEQEKVRALNEALEEIEKTIATKYAAITDRQSGGFRNASGQLSLKEKMAQDLETLKEARQNQLITQEEFNAQELAIEMEFQAAKRDLKVAEYESMAASLADSFKNMFGEQSKAYKAMFIVEKGFAIARSLMAIQTGIAMASALPFPANIGAMLSVAAATGNIVATLKGIAMPQLSGQAHDGLANVPREGTYLLDAGERVVKPRDNQKLTKFLDGEQSGGTNGRSDVKVFVTNMTDSQVVTTRNTDGDLELKIMKAINQQIPAQLANPSSPIGKSLSGNWQTAPRR